MKKSRKGDRRSRTSDHHWKHNLATINNDDKTGKKRGTSRILPSFSRSSIYLIVSPGIRKVIVSSSSKRITFSLILRAQSDQLGAGETMASEGSRNASANRELKRARAAYETCTSQKEKQKIEELEAIFSEEEKNLEAREVEKDMD